MTDAKKRGRRPRPWSYSAGEWGANRVRVFDRGAKRIFLEYRVRDDATGRVQRVRVALKHSNRERAKQQADEVALRFRTAEPSRPAELTLGQLFDLYRKEVTPHKGITSRRHDDRCADMFCRFFGRDRKPATLSIRDWNRFIAARRLGTVAPAGVTKQRPVGDRIVEQDLKTLLAVLNWATRAGDGRGGVLLERNPLRGLPLPKNESPARPAVTAEQYDALRAAAKRFNPRVECFLVLAHETGHRAASIRQLRWSDVDFEARTVRWRGENDKIGLEHTTPLTDDALSVLQQARARAKAIGEAWIFPHGRDASLPLSEHAAGHMWKRLAVRAGLPAGQRLGWHSLRRTFASELKREPLKDLCHLGGWKNPAVLLECYIKPDQATQREALARRRQLRAGGIS